MNSSAAVPALSPLTPAQPAGSPHDDDEIHLSEYVDILLDRKWLVAGVTAVAVALGTAYALLATPVYQSNLLIQVEDSAPDAKGFLGDSASLFDVKTPASGEIQIIRSRLVMGDAVDATRLYIDAKPRYVPLIGGWLARRAKGLSDPGFLGMDGYVSGKEGIDIAKFDVPASMEDGKPFTISALADGRYMLAHEDLDQPLTGTVGKPLAYTGADGSIDLVVARLNGKPGAEFTVSRASRLGIIENLQKRVQLSEQGKQSNVINAALEDSNRDRLKLILNEIGAQYVRQNVERKAAEAQKTLDFLDRQLPQFKTQLEASEDAYTRFRNKHGTVAFDEEAKLVLGQSVELQTKLLEAQQRRRELAARYTDTNPKVQTIDGQIGAIQHEIGSLNNRVSGMPTLQQDALRLERDVRVNGELYKSLLNSALQLRLVKEGKIGNVRLLDKAVEPKIPVKPQKPLVVALSLVLGLLAGIAAAILRSRFHAGIRSPQEIEAHTGLNVYAN
ncbi:MAG: tyrosine protein kinase, partial [Variovorax sp.]